MGWLFGWDDRKSLADHLSSPGVWAPEGTTDVIRRECLKRCFKGNHMWTLWEVTRNGKPQERYVVLFMLQKDGRDGWWGYKDVDETMGPAYYSCPVSYLDASEELRPKGSEYSTRWREGVRRRAKIRGQKIEPGMEIVLRNGRTYRVESNRRGRILAFDVETGQTYRIPRSMLTEEVSKDGKKIPVLS